MDKPTSLRMSRSVAVLMAAAAIAPLTTSVYGQGIAERELARRLALVSDADAALEAGRTAYAEKDFENAVAQYRLALQLLPYAPSTENRRTEYLAHLGDASVALSQDYRKIGKYTEARALLQEVTAPDADPNNKLALQELEYLDDPIRTNPALTFEHTQNVDEVRRLLYTGEGYFNLGDFDRAELVFQEVLRVDRYNTAARRWLERVANLKSDYYEAAYDQTRAKLLSQVDAAWELTVPANDQELVEGPNGQTTSQQNQASILNKLRNIRIDSVVLEDVTVEEAIDYLRQRSFELDTTTTDPTRRGINFVIQKPSAGAAAPADGGFDLTGGGDVGGTRIAELKLRNVPLEFALKSLVDQANLKYKIDEFAVTILPKTSAEGEDIISRTFVVRPDFLSILGSNGGGGDAAPADPFADPAPSNSLGARASVQQLLADSGVGFPDGASASILGSNLVVNNTSTNLDLIEQIVESIERAGPKQIMIATKFVEVSQENTDELGFDWLLSPFNTGNELFLGGGNNVVNAINQFVPSAPLPEGITPPVAPVPFAGSDLNADNLRGITGGNRSGDFALDSNSIDAVLNNPNRTSQTANQSPGILALTGLFSNSQLQVVMRGLQQKKGTDIMTAPSVLARSGQTAKIEIIREFIYPTEYEPPELPNEVGSGFSIGGGVTGGGSFPVTPATPTAFETRNTGVTLEIEPTLGANDYTIDLRFVPEIVEFEGFVNYGSPITAGTTMTGAPNILTDNRIEQPVFSSRRVTTGLTIYDGHTVAVGGLMREDVQNVEDQVPILGDIPIIGRLFQSKSENRIKSNLIIFVTASIIDPTGRPIRGSELDLPDRSIDVEPVGVLPALPTLPSFGK